MKLITRPLRLASILFIITRYYWMPARKLSRGERIRRTLEELGPIFVKAGQIASTRRDIIPDDIATELCKLQDRVPPFSSKQAKRIIQKALNSPIETNFSEFNATALASASIAQVHAARLITGEEVVIKVLRPNIAKIIERDVDILMSLASIANRYWSQAKHFKPKEIVNEVALTLSDELDLLREGANASQLRRNFANCKKLYVPKIYWDYCRHNVLVLERIHGIPIHNIEALKNAGINMKKLAERCIEIFFTQVFRDSYFHADLHPGNIFVSTESLQDPQCIVVDFGIVGSLNQNDQRYLAENMIAFFKRDYQRIAELHIASGWIPPDTRIDQFEGAIRSVSEPIFEKPLRDISFGHLLLRLFQVGKRFNINIQPQLILLQKTLLSIESLCRSLSPELDLWSTSSPQIEKWLKKQVGVKAFFGRIREQLPMWSEQLPQLPSMIFEVLKEKKQQQERIRFVQTIASENETNNKTQLKITYFIAGASVAGFVASVLIYFI